MAKTKVKTVYTGKVGAPPYPNEKYVSRMTFCIPSKNNLRYIKWAIESIRKNAMRDDHYIHILVDKIRPNILNTLTDDYKEGLSIPETTFWRRKKE